MTKYNFKNFLLFALLITLYRLFVLYHVNIDLHVDEAYYWGWSKHLSFGYYSKPPMIAWVIHLASMICGDNEICIKLPSLILYLLTSINIFFIAKNLFNEKTAFFSALTFITTPLVSFYSMAITTDSVLLFFYSLTLYFFIKAIKEDKLFYWIIAGIAGGLGLLSKYNMILFILSVVIYIFLCKKKEFKKKNLYIAMIIAAAIYLPNLIWNYHHNFITFDHIEDISEIDRKLFHPKHLLNFILTQFGVFGPVFFGVLLYLLIKPYFKNCKYKLLYSFAFVFLGVISLQAFLTRAFANWASATYIAGTVLVIAYLIEKNKINLIKTGIAINLLAAILFYHYHDITKALHITLTSKTDPFKRVLGWREVADRLKPIIQKYHYPLMFDDRVIMAEMIYYLKPNAFNSVMFNPSHKIENQYDMDTKLKTGKNYIYVTKENHAKKYFKNSKLIAIINAPLYKDFNRTYKVFFMKNFKGY
ncbi:MULTISPECIES: glycosyltransferase family 39 protein [unclassified Lebetimonas]|uniref:glycosyltransferase family 39 protein n=2 Tax=Lebetimonas TaxID=267989 RepID=UPI00046510EA|nr:MULTISPECIES: glycosyltransferase family 39 protein [unclassified Lebetimonas]